MLALDDPDQLIARLKRGDQRALASLRTLHDAIVAGHAVEDVIVQDEFTHDVVIALGEVWAVFDST